MLLKITIMHIDQLSLGLANINLFSQKILLAELERLVQKEGGGFQEKSLNNFSYKSIVSV
jgi:hypothetical protein